MRAADRYVGAAMCLAFAAGTFAQEAARNRVDPVQDTDEMQHMDHAQHDRPWGPKAGPSPHRAADMEHADRSKDATGAEAPTAPPKDEASTSTPTSSEREHVAPDPPQHEVPPMAYSQMAGMMAMDDREAVGKVLIDRFEWRDANGGSALEWDGAAWYGGDYNKLWFKTEGMRRTGTTEDARSELLWDRIVSRWWSLQTGIRQDFGVGPSRTWAALGVQGLAPYFFEVEATAYVGEGGRSAARLSTQCDLLFTQRLILQPEAEVNFYGKEDPSRRIGSGLSDLEVGLRVRYEVRRAFAPYLALVWSRRFGTTATLARAAGEGSDDLQFVAGLRVWF
jgi:copper resistance protein B